MAQDADGDSSGLPADAQKGDEVAQLAAQLGLSPAEAQTAWDTVLNQLAISEVAGTAAEEEMATPLSAERFDAGALIDLLGSGKKPDIAELAKDEIAKAVAKKLGVDPGQADTIVAAVMQMVGKPAPKRRRKKPASAAKPAAKKKPSTAKSTAKKKPSTAKPAAKKKPSTAGAPGKKKPSTAKPAAEEKPSTTKPAAKKKPSTAKPTAKKRPSASKPASAKKPAQPRKRPATRSGSTASDAEKPAGT